MSEPFKLWKRDPKRTYPGDFTVHIYKETVHPPVNGWDILEVFRVFSWNHSPGHEIEERRWHAGTNLDPKKFQAGKTVRVSRPIRGQLTDVIETKPIGPPGGFLRHASFDSREDAHQWANMIPHAKRRRSP